MPHRICIRNAAAGDVEAIHALLNPYAEMNIILGRDQDNIFQHLQEFLVAEYDGDVAGVVAMHVYDESLAEIRSLVVRPDCQKHGIGRLLVEGCEKWAAGLGVTKVFALTYVDAFFAKLGYKTVSKESLPHKIWTVCVHCARFADCDEVAVRKDLANLQEPVPLTPIIDVEQG